MGTARAPVAGSGISCPACNANVSSRLFVMLDPVSKFHFKLSVINKKTHVPAALSGSGLRRLKTFIDWLHERASQTRGASHGHSHAAHDFQYIYGSAYLHLQTRDCILILYRGPDVKGESIDSLL